MATAPSQYKSCKDKKPTDSGLYAPPARKKSPISGRKIGNILAGAAILMVLTLNLLAYAGRLPLWALRWPYSDKVIHFLAYAGLTLGLFARLGHQRVQIGSGSIPLIILLTTATALGDEGLQSLSAARSLELADLLSNLAGMACVWLGLSVARRRSIPSQLPPASASSHDSR